MRESAADWRRTFRRRVQVAVAVLAIWVVGIEVRLAYLQIFKYDEMVARADRQHKRTIPLPAKRGDILDRNGQLLATSHDADTIYAAPSMIGSAARETVRKLCQALGDCDAEERKQLTERLGRTRDHFAHVRRQVPREVAERVMSLKLEGIGTFKESKRYYPNGDLGAAVIGFVGTENRGLAGLEHAYNRQIRGEDGRVLIQNDAKGRVFSSFSQPPTAGSSLELTIDRFLQHITERALEAGVVREPGPRRVRHHHGSRTRARSSRWRTSRPSIPNVYNRSTETARRNRCVQDVYEPGSTFKVVTASAAMEDKVMPLGSTIETGPGRILIGRRVIDEYRGHNYGTLSFEDVIVKSSNVGAVKIGFRVGTERLSRFVDLFGFGHRVSPDFPGENPGIVWSADSWTEGALASVSMGYQVGVTPMQVVAAVSAVANRGQYIEPRVVRAAETGTLRQTVKPKLLRTVISEATAAALTAIMERVVEAGTAKAAAIPGYTIAGKTGTAEKLVNGRYSPVENNVSFVGFVPSRNPALSIIVMIDAPRAGGNSGGSVAAPVFKAIAEPALRYLAIPESIDTPAPILVNAAVSGPTPVATSVVKEPPEIPIVVTPTLGPGMPDLTGLSAREAMGIASEIGLAPLAQRRRRRRFRSRRPPAPRLRTEASSG